MTVLSGAQTEQRINAIGVELATAPAFAYADEAHDVVYDWHAHSRHQLLYSFRGTVHLEVAQTRFLLPPQRAAWIPAGILHRTHLNQVSCGSVFFSSDMLSSPPEQVRIIAASPVVREMILYAMRWPVHRRHPDALADNYFQTLALLCQEWVLEEMPFWLPHSSHPQIGKAINYIQTHLATATIGAASRAAAMSERTFRRQFAHETNMNWRQFLLHSRLLHAMHLLSQPGSRVTEVAAEVGFSSLSAFAKAFTQFTGEAPSAYRARISLR